MRRSLLAFCAICIFAVVFAPAAATAAPGKCEAPFILDPLCEAGKTVGGKTGDLLTAPFRAAAGGAVEMITSWVADTAQWILGRVVKFIDTSTSPALDAGWFMERYRFMIGLAALVLLPMLLIATIRAIMTQDIGQLSRSFFVYLPVAVIGTFVAVNLTQALLGITDAMSSAVARGIAGDVSRIFDSVGGSLSKSVGVVNPAIPSFAIFFGALLLVFGSFFVWLELLVRSAAVTAAVFFLPMILAGLVWPAAMRWTKRLIEILFALIVSKFVIVAVISLATAALAEPGGGGFGTIMGAAALMLMAAFSPFALLKLMPMVEGAAIDHLQGKGRGPIEAMRSDGGVHQAISVMRAKTRQGASGLAVAGRGTPAAATAAGGAVVIPATKAAGSSVEKRAEKHPEVSSQAGRDSAGVSKRRRGGGDVSSPPTTSKPSGKGE